MTRRDPTLPDDPDDPDYLAEFGLNPDGTYRDHEADPDLAAPDDYPDQPPLARRRPVRTVRATGDLL